MPLCLLTTLSVVILVVLAFYLLPLLERRGPGLDLDRPGPFQPLARQDAIQALNANRTPKGLSYRLEGERILDVRYRGGHLAPAFDLQVEEVEIVALDEQHWPPLYGDLRLRGFDLVFERAELPPWLQRIKGDAVFTYRFNPESGTLDLPQVAVQVPSLGLAEFAVSLDGINPVIPLTSLTESAISTLSLRLRDEGLIAHALALLAKREGLPEETLRMNLHGLASLLQSETGYPFLRELLQAVKVVTNHRGDGLVIDLSATPEQSFPLARLARLKLSPLPDLSVLNALNLRIEAR